MRAYEEKEHLTLRPMLAKDLDTVYAIEIAAHEHPWSFANFLDSLEEDHNCYVLEDHGIIIGYALFFVVAGEAHLLNIVIDPIVQGRGYGKKLLLAIIEHARAQNAEEMFLEVRPSNTKATRLYESLGFNSLWYQKKLLPCLSRSGRCHLDAEDLGVKNPHAWRELGLFPYFRRKKSAEVIASKEILWQQLEEKVQQCTLCRLHETRTHVVFGMGDKNADWFFIGEGPGEQEDLQGKPFVGPAGKLLDEMLKALGLSRFKQVYIANVVKCRPPQNRVPKPDEIQSCLPYLLEQIRLVEPKIIVVLGKTAATAL